MEKHEFLRSNCGYIVIHQVRCHRRGRAVDADMRRSVLFPTHHVSHSFRALQYTMTMEGESDDYKAGVSAPASEHGKQLRLFPSS